MERPPSNRCRASPILASVASRLRVPVLLRACCRHDAGTDARHETLTRTKLLDRRRLPMKRAEHVSDESSQRLHKLSRKYGAHAWAISYSRRPTPSTLHGAGRLSVNMLTLLILDACVCPSKREIILRAYAVMSKNLRRAASQATPSALECASRGRMDICAERVCKVPNTISLLR